MSITVKALFIIPTDTHNYKIIGMLKTIKILTVAPTCFGSRRNYHQGVLSCLAKTAIMILLCSSLMTWSMLWRRTSLLCKHAVHGRGRHECNFFKFITYISRQKHSTHYTQFTIPRTWKETHSIQAIIPLIQQFPSRKLRAIVSFGKHRSKSLCDKQLTGRKYTAVSEIQLNSLCYVGDIYRHLL